MKSRRNNVFIFLLVLSNIYCVLYPKWFVGVRSEEEGYPSCALCKTDTLLARLQYLSPDARLQCLSPNAQLQFLLPDSRHQSLLPDALLGFNLSRPTPGFNLSCLMPGFDISHRLTHCLKCPSALLCTASEGEERVADPCLFWLLCVSCTIQNTCIG